MPKGRQSAGRIERCMMRAVVAALLITEVELLQH